MQRRLERMREAAAGQLRREDVLRHLAQLAFGRSADGVRLALQGREADLDEMDLSAVAEIRVTDKGGVELKFLDRVRALEALYTLLEGDGAQGSALGALSGADGGVRRGRRELGARLRYCIFLPSSAGCLPGGASGMRRGRRSSATARSAAERPFPWGSPFSFGHRPALTGGSSGFAARPSPLCGGIS